MLDEIYETWGTNVPYRVAIDQLELYKVFCLNFYTDKFNQGKVKNGIINNGILYDRLKQNWDDKKFNDSKEFLRKKLKDDPPEYAGSNFVICSLIDEYKKLAEMSVENIHPSIKTYRFEAIDTVNGVTTQKLPECISKQLKYLKSFKAVVGKKVKVLRNKISKNRYIAKNSFGIIVDIQLEPKIIIKFKPIVAKGLQADSIEIEQYEEKVKYNGYEYTRRQFPFESGDYVHYEPIQGLSIAEQILFNATLIYAYISIHKLYTLLTRNPSPADILALYRLTVEDIQVDAKCKFFDKHHRGSDIENPKYTRSEVTYQSINIKLGAICVNTKNLNYHEVVSNPLQNLKPLEDNEKVYTYDSNNILDDIEDIFY